MQLTTKYKNMLHLQLYENKMFYHFIVSLVFRMLAIVKEEISKLSVFFPPSVQELEGNMNTWMSHQLLYQPTQFLRASILSVQKNLHLHA